MKNSLILRLTTLILTWILLPGFVVAASSVDETFTLENQASYRQDIKDSLMQAGQELESAQNEFEVEKILQTTLPPIKTAIISCIENNKEQADEKRGELQQLGESSTEEALEIYKLRQDLNDEIGRAVRQGFECKELETRYDDLFSKASDKKGELTAERLLRYNFSLISSIGEFPQNLPKLIDRGKNSFKVNTTQQSSFQNWLLGIVFSLFGLGLGLLGKRYSHNWISSRKGPAGNPPYEFNLIDSLNSYMAVIFCGLAGVISFNSLNSQTDDWNLPTRIAFSVLLFGILSFVFKWLKRENSPGDSLHFINKQIPKALVKRLHYTTIVFIAGFIIFGFKWFAQLPANDLHLPYAIGSIAMGIAIISILSLAGEFTDLKGRYRFLRVLLIVASFLAIISVITGYVNAANYLLFASLTTMIAAFSLWILLWCLEQAVDGIVNGKTKTSYKLRASLGIRAEETSSELGWLRLLTGLGLWASFGLFLLYVWDFTDRAIPQVKLLATDGFQLSENMRFVPKNILIGLGVFAIVLSISLWLKARLERQWLRNIGMDRGSRDAVVTLTGYLGMIIALIMGLTAAGVSFSGLALVAGALSVGIGFGLQNIVNNFISGLILLFERPIHAGDYISVGDVEGTVKRISIRSTEIETLERTNVIVPNSELISGQVMNWVLHDAFGVIKIPVGVAYGTDTELVKQLLLEVVHEHPEIVARPNLQQPTVRFESFGDSSLDFTIVVIVKNINKRFDVISDINFSIDQKFKEHNIEIPFPQRDLHIRATDSGNETVIPELFKERKSEVEEVDPEKGEQS